jgi:NADH-quinone oxidoreductase subunit M
MILIWLIIIPFLGGLIAWSAAGQSSRASRWIALFTLLIDLLLVLSLWAQYVTLPHGVQWIAQIDYPWIPDIGVGFHLALDGLSLLMVGLTAMLGIAAILCSWNEIQERVGLYHFALLAALSGVTGVFLAMDLVLFYFFWEVMLVPMYLLIGIWGSGKKVYAAVRFFLFTQAGGLLMLTAILGLYFVHGAGTGEYTFDYFRLLGTKMAPPLALMLMLGFFAAFAVKLPMFPLHVWAPDTYSCAPTGGSVLLAGVLSKTAGYGLLRFVLPLFPGAAAHIAPIAMVLAVVGIIYAAVLAFAQTDLKRLVAYSSISHLGFVLLGIFALNQYGIQGSVVEMVAHGFSITALFILVGVLQERIGTREIGQMGGLWATAPKMGAMALVFALATLGLPGFGNFIGEFLVLIGAFRANHWITLFATGGLILAVIYALWFLLRTFLGENVREWKIADLSRREMAIMSVLTAILLFIGLFPQFAINAAGPLVRSLPTGALVANETHSTPDSVGFVHEGAAYSSVRTSAFIGRYPAAKEPAGHQLRQSSLSEPLVRETEAGL